MTPDRPPIDGTPRNLKALFPEASSVFRDRAGLWARIGGRRFALRQGVLAAPPFAARLVWTSGELVEPSSDAAPSEDTAARGRALLDAMAEARVGGTFWAGRPESDGRPILACLPDDEQIRARMLGYVRERHAAEAIRLLDRPCDPWPLIEACETLHVGDDTPLALLALAAGKRVVCHAATSLSGWGATEDVDGVERRGRRASAGALAAALLLRARYADPFRDRACSPEEIIAILDEWRRGQARKKGVASTAGIGFWKKPHVRALLDADGRPVLFATSAGQAVKQAAERGGAVLSWPSTAPPGLAAAAAAAQIPVWRIEDGFIRSAGLGVHGVPPCSIVIDRLGAHYDPRTASDLEAILERTVFTPQTLTRAAALCEALVARGVSKYNVAGGATARAFAPPQGRRAVLVPGQVMDDVSVAAGGLGVASNLELLQRVRAHAPDAFIIYKPHPDVLSGHRAGAIRRADAERYADAVVTDAAIPALLDQVQEVHTLSSLTGFEALLRRRRVVAYGHPFYAGWGLTEDVVPVARRTRRLTVTELAAGALILYPLYIDPVTMLPCPVELLLERLGDPRLRQDRLRIWLRQGLGRLRRMRQRRTLAAEWC